MSSWDPRPLVAPATEAVLEHRPSVLLVRAGLTVPDTVLTASETIADMFAIAPGQRWGMSPFAGSVAEDAWHATDLSVFLVSHRSCPTVHAAFRLAYDLPPVSRIAVGTSNPEHLRELLDATGITVSAIVVRRYRELIRARAAEGLEG